MPRPAVSVLAVALAAVGTMALAACGEEDAQLLPGGTAREITANLDTVQQLADEGDCLGAESAAQQVSEQVDALGGVDRRLKQALQDGATRLNEVVASCEEETEAIAPDVPAPETETVAPDKKDEDEKDEDEEKKDKDDDEDDEEREEEDEADEAEGEEGETEPSLPPQANGEGKGLDNGNGEGPGGEGAPSGGVGPGTPAGEGG